MSDALKCAWCGKEFMPNRRSSHQRFCGRPCHREWEKVKYRDGWKKEDKWHHHSKLVREIWK